MVGSPTEVADIVATRSFQFPDFKAAFAFMTEVAAEAERLDHHPWWANEYGRVEFRLRTHDAGDEIARAEVLEGVGESVECVVRVSDQVTVGVLLGGLVFLFPTLYGEGYNTVELLLRGHAEHITDASIFSVYEDNNPWLLLVLRAMFT